MKRYLVWGKLDGKYTKLMALADSEEEAIECTNQRVIDENLGKTWNVETVSEIRRYKPY